ncbi:MAG: carboxypeptidase M32 [Granulosicoccus sp.]
MSQTLQKVEAQFHRIAQLDHATTFLSWDQMVIMPDAGLAPRSSAIAELSTLRHEILTAPAMNDWLQEVRQEFSKGLIEPEKGRHLLEMERAWQRAMALPASLVHAQVMAGSRCEYDWRTQRAENDWDGFLENFREVVSLSREEARCRQAQRPDDFATPYDALLDLHCSGDSQELIHTVFAQLKDVLPELIGEVTEKQRSRNVPDLSGEYPIEQQQKLCEKLMQSLGFDFSAGRLDVSMHPFSTGVRGDQRITTRYRTGDFADALQATAHETGHASYEAGLPQQWQSYPVGQSRNMCVHESQSLFYEKHLYLSRAFGSDFVRYVHEYLPASARFSADELWFSQTQVQPDYIRVEADELTYPMHVMLRYDIESALINGDIEPDVIPEMWDEGMRQYLGISTGSEHAKGCLQDIHWTDGSFGYFPSYTMGAVNAAQISHSIKQAHPDWQTAFARGDIAFARNWLSENIWQRASEMESQELMISATGEGSSATCFIEHLKRRYLEEVD